MNRRFGVVNWIDNKGREGLALKVCMDCQPITDLEVKRDIEYFVWLFNLLAVTTTLCKSCRVERDKELKKYLKINP
jgi:hypothetical protein